MKNPNGYGSIYKQGGKRREPFVARKTLGWDENGKQIRRIIGYYETRTKALQALAEFNTNPYSVEVSTITFSEVFEKWSIDKFNTISQSNINGYKAAYKTCKSLHEIKFVDLKTTHMQNIINTCGKGHGTLRKIKVLFNQLYKFAMANDIVSKDYSNFIELPLKEKKSSRKVFTAKEIKRLFEVQEHIQLVDTILIMIYTGLRIGELLQIKKEDIDIENRLIKGGIKTEAGKDRLIPINSKILPFIEKRIKSTKKYLVENVKGEQMKYDNYYRDNFAPLMEQLEMDHKPHDCRHTFATLMNNANANKTSIKKLIGHSSYTTTEKIYTHKDIEELKKAIDLI